jgi:hypothetical protein
LPFVQSESVLASWKALGRPLKVWLHDMDRTAGPGMLAFLGRKTGPLQEGRGTSPCTKSSGYSTRRANSVIAPFALGLVSRSANFSCALGRKPVCLWRPELTPTCSTFIDKT